MHIPIINIRQEFFLNGLITLSPPKKPANVDNHVDNIDNPVFNHSVYTVFYASKSAARTKTNCIIYFRRATYETFCRPLCHKLIYLQDNYLSDERSVSAWNSYGKSSPGSI